MASITKQSNGRRTVQFVGSDGKRRSVRLGKVSQRTAESIKFRIEQFNSAMIANHAVDSDTAAWVATLPDEMHKKLARVGLVQERSSSTLGQFIDSYIVLRSDVEESTRLKYMNTRRNLVEYFGPNRNLRDINLGDAEEWRLNLLESDLAESTISKRIKIAQMMFRFAARKKLVIENPFKELPTPEQINSEKEHFVTLEASYKLFDACPDAEWRVLFALCRFGGLRCPSEVLALTWDDVDWEHQRIHVSSRKTKRYRGKGSRIIPLFPELRPYLEEAFELAEPGTTHVINRYRDSNANLRTQLIRIVKRVGLTPWQKPFQNLRSTRETELCEEYPIHVACAWIGNSTTIASKHYLQVTDEHFERAVQNAVQQAHEITRTESQADLATCQNAAGNGTLRLSASQDVPPQGLEP